MKGSSELYRLVYDYYATRILFGFYAHGDALPSILKICARFQLAIPTVRTALAHLERDGFIKVEASKVARVTYKAGPKKIRENTARYFLPREDGLRDIGVAGQILFEPLWEAGLSRLDLTAPSPDVLFIPLELYIAVFSSLNNKLLLNL